MTKADAQQASGHVDFLQRAAQRGARPLPEHQRIVAETEAPQELENPTAELRAHVHSSPQDESERATFLKRSIVDRVREMSTSDALEHLLRWLDDARRRGMLSGSTYTDAKATAVNRWLQDGPQQIDPSNADPEDMENRTTELFTHPSTVELSNQVPVATPKPEPALPPKKASTPFVATTDSFQPGRTIRGRYVLEELIGQGGFANVYRALDLRRDTTDGSSPYVALKVLRPELRDRPGTTSRFKREFRQTQLLPHAAIVRIFDLDAHDGIWFMVMELLEGETLAARLQRLAGAPMAFTEAHALLATCADALSFAHEHHIVHGDFKPTNVFTLHDGSVRVVDFGSSPDMNANVSDSKPSQMNQAATPAYASPQVLACASAEPRDDLFSFACVSFEILAGYHPFTLRSSTQVQASDGAVLDFATLSPELMAILKQGLAWRREDRPASVREFFQSLTALLVAAPESIHRLENASTDTSFAPPPVLPVPDDHSAGGAVDIPETQPPAALPEAPIEPIEPIEPVVVTAPPAPAVIDTATTPVISAPQLAISQEVRPPPAKPTLPRRSPTGSLRLLYGCSALLALAYLGFLAARAPQAELTLTNATQSAVPPLEFAPLKVKPSLAVLTLPQGFIKPLAGTAARTPHPLPVGQSTQATANKRPQSVSFSTNSMTVTPSAGLAAIILKRSHGHAGRLRVKWQLKPGSAEIGQDFSGPTSGFAEFADNQQVRTLFVPLLNNPNRSGDRTFVVKLTSVSDSTVITPIHTVNVTILDVS